MNGYVMNVAALAATSVHWLHRDSTVGGAEGASPQKVKLSKKLLTLLHRHRCEVYKVPKRGVLIQIKCIYRTGINRN